MAIAAGSDTVEFEVRDGIARATFTRPEAYNALDLPTAAAWNFIAHEVVERSDVACLVVAGRGKAFCAGGDLRAMSAGGPDYVTELARLLHDGILTLTTSATPVLAQVEGIVAGGGLGLVLASDYAIASDTATFTVGYTKVGLSPDMSVSALLSQAVGERRALELTLHDRTLSAPEALDWGLVAEVLPAADVAERANEIATGWAANHEAIGQSKRLIRAGTRRDLGATLDDEQVTIARLLDSPEARARIARFITRAG